MPLTRRDNHVLLTALGYLGCITTWGAVQLWDKAVGYAEGFEPLLFFLMVHMSLFGIALSLAFAKRFGIELHKPTTK